MKRLSPMQRGFLMGLRRARAQARRELNDQVDRFENVVAEIHARCAPFVSSLRVCGRSITLSSPSASLRCGRTRACTHEGADVGYRRLSRNLLLDQSIAGFDPDRTCGPL